jgi:hypothetical protein
MAPKPSNAVLDRLHRATVYFLVGSTLYFTVEVFRGTWYIQKAKYEAKQVRGCMGAWAASGDHAGGKSAVEAIACR